MKGEIFFGFVLHLYSKLLMTNFFRQARFMGTKPKGVRSFSYKIRLERQLYEYF